METVAGQYCSQCGQSFSPSELVMIAGNQVCAACKPALLRRLQEGGMPGTAGAATLRYKGFWIRFVALFLDGLVLDLVLVPMIVLAGGFAEIFHAAAQNPGNPNAAAVALAGVFPRIMLLELFSIVLIIGYKTLMVGRYAATLGKMAIDAKVVNSDGGRVSYGRAAARAGAEIISGVFTMGIGYLIAAFDDKKRALHDRIAGTLVVAK